MRLDHRVEPSRYFLAVRRPRRAERLRIAQQRSAEEKRKLPLVPRRGFRPLCGMRQMMGRSVGADECPAELHMVCRRERHDKPRRRRADPHRVIGGVIDEIDQNRSRTFSVKSRPLARLGNAEAVEAYEQPNTIAADEGDGGRDAIGGTRIQINVSAPSLRSPAASCSTMVLTLSYREWPRNRTMARSCIGEISALMPARVSSSLGSSCPRKTAR
jgi:hypothetical protein